MTTPPPPSPTDREVDFVIDDSTAVPQLQLYETLPKSTAVSSCKPKTFHISDFYDDEAEEDDKEDDDTDDEVDEGEPTAEDNKFIDDSFVDDDISVHERADFIQDLNNDRVRQRLHDIAVHERAEALAKQQRYDAVTKIIDDTNDKVAAIIDNTANNNSSSSSTQPPLLRRTDTDSRNFLLAAHNDILPDSPSEFDHYIPSAPGESTTTTTSSNRGKATEAIVLDETPSTASNDLRREGEGGTSDWDLFRNDEPRTQLQRSGDGETGCGSQPTNGGRFRLKHKRIALTYPHCGINIQLICDELRSLCSDYMPDLIIVAEEQTPGNPHRHAYIRLGKPLATTDQRFFDVQSPSGQIYHPNIQAVKDETKWEKYICKCNNYTCYPGWYVPDWNAIDKAKEQKKSTKSDLVSQRILKGESPDDLMQDHPGFFLMHGQQIQRFANVVQQATETKALRLRFKHLACFVGDGHMENQRIAGWFNDHVIRKHEFRAKNLWVWGPTQIGKTTLAEQLRDNGVNTYVVDYSTHFYDGISNDTQLVVYDEFKAQRTITELNKLSDGSRCRLDIKGGSFQLQRPLPVLVLSNFSIDQVYPHVEKNWLDTLKSRFFEIECKQHITITATHRTDEEIQRDE